MSRCCAGRRRCLRSRAGPGHFTTRRLAVTLGSWRLKLNGFMDFPAHLATSAANSLRVVDANEARDVYVVSFFVYDEEDDPRRPTLTVGTNTESQVYFVQNQPEDFAKPNPWWTPSDEPEARWNYAFWLQNRLGRIGDTGADPVGAGLREQWIRAQGLWYEEPDDDDQAAWRRIDDVAPAITAAFVQLCCATALELHNDGLITTVFGRPIPIIVHELEYYDKIAFQTAAANPPGLAQPFVDWIDSMYQR